MKRKKVETYEYVLTKDEIEMVAEICAMCVNRNLHLLGDHKGYYDNIKTKAGFLYREINNRARLDCPIEKGGVQE